ncbi:MAG: hypothetical protein LBV79_05715 [Candidatus Adiutrix sp.]|jgi:hypothetical protein|nr:hypothetical protein [Candidatus Adiutrix sp.]
MTRRKKEVVILLIVLLAAAVRWWFTDGQYKYNYTIESIEPAAITEPLHTWYAGAAAVDVPESLRLYKSTVAFRSGIWPNAAHLEFTDRKESLPSDTFRLPSPNSTSKKLGQQDVTSMLGRPAQLAVHFYSRPLNKKDSPEKPSVYFLFFSAAIREGEAVYEFSHTELLEQTEAPGFTDDFVVGRKLAFIKQRFDFLDIYHWTGRNEPPAANQLATGFGYIDLSGGWPHPVIETSLLFQYPDADLERSYLFGDFLTFEAWHIQNKSSPYRFEVESIPTFNDVSWDMGFFSITQEKRKNFDFGNQAAILANLRLYALPPKSNKAYHSYLVGVFNTVFESLRMAGESRPD